MSEAEGPSRGRAAFRKVDTLRSPKLTAVVADMLRRMIVSGELAPGDNLPPEPEIMAQLGVSRPTLREALRVLESESLIRPRRGSRSGAEVRAPSVEVSARYMGFVLQYKGISVEDVLRARCILEPPLAGVLASTRNATKLKRLRAVLAEEEASLDDPIAFG
ncbi:MAG TPA: GntR family transcriptional regulator, partial [Solirubrobacteraceae bacterium]|nr:GntR family transcriptional regulator [Solirubrobacteraceae bacterium]